MNINWAVLQVIISYCSAYGVSKVQKMLSKLSIKTWNKNIIMFLNLD